jgi:hypothetical protein
MHRFAPPTHPPQFTFRPWHSLTLRIANLQQTDLTFALVYGYLLSQLELSPTANAGNAFNVRFKGVRAWGAISGQDSSSSLQPLNVIAYSLIEGEASNFTFNQVLEVYSDYPDQVNRAKIGFRYPEAHSSVPILVGTANTAKFLTVTGANGPGSLILIDILFRSASVSIAGALGLSGSAHHEAGYGHTEPLSDCEILSDFETLSLTHRANRTARGSHRSGVRPGKAMA